MGNRTDMTDRPYVNHCLGPFNQMAPRHCCQGAFILNQSSV